MIRSTRLALISVVALLVPGYELWKGSATVQGPPTYVAESAPLVSIGDSSAGRPYVLTRVTDALRMSGGHIVVAVCGAREIRSYDSSGKHLATASLAATAQRLLWRIFPAGGDTIAAVEAINTRLTLLDGGLSIVGTVGVPHPDAQPAGLISPSPLDVIGRFADGTFLGRLSRPALADSGIQRRPMSFYKFDSSGRIIDSLAGIPGLETHVVPPPGRSSAVRLGRTTVAAVFPDRLAVGSQDNASVAEYDSNLRLAGSTRTITTPAPVTDSERATWVRIAQAREHFPTGGVAPVYGEAYPETMAAYRHLVAGVDGRLWVQDPERPDTYPLVWTAYRNGMPDGRAELPPRFYPTQFGPDWVLGIGFDSVATETVQLLRLRAGPLQNLKLTPRAAAPANRPQCGAWTSR